MSGWEYLAVVLSMAYLLLALKQSLWCWPAAFISTLIYTLLFYQGALLMESILNIYYMAMAAYGWYCWHRGGLLTHQTEELPIQSWSNQIHFRVVCITFAVAMGLGFIMDSYTHADYAYLDSTTTCFSIVATYLVAKKVLENWIYWVIIDGLSMYLFVSKGFYPTTVLFGFYTIMSVWGYISWQDDYSQQQNASPNPT